MKVKQENIDVSVKTDHVHEQKDVKTENEDEQNIKVDVTSSPGYVYFKNIKYLKVYCDKYIFRQSVLKPARKRGGARREGVLVDCVDDGRIYSTEDTRKKVSNFFYNFSLYCVLFINDFHFRFI